ncbi:MAG: hypothetical protein GY940_33000, partial [bacterium]|nr:hypothetical protein [bacterium]
MNNKSNSSKTWLAAYLYYSEPWQEFLVQAVKPFARSILDKELAEGYFFIRYWEKGPHIRLRFKGDAQQLETDVKPLLETHFNTYFNQKPSDRSEPENMDRFPAEWKWFPNNSVQYIPYEPENERYGGPVCMEIGEKQFEASSDAILSVIEESEGWDYERALGAAIQLHLGFSFALGMDLTETSGFYSRISRLWFNRSYGYDKDISAEELKRRQEVTLKAFADNFSKQKAALVPFHETVWDAFEQGAEFEQEWLNQWLTDMAGIGKQLQEAQSKGQVEVPEWYNLPPMENIPEKRQQLWAILESYVHMTNNRLG